MIELSLNDEFIEGENLSNFITVTVSENLANAVLRLEFRNTNFDRYTSEVLPVENNKATYAVPKSVLSYSGKLEVQTVAVMGDYIEKSRIYTYEVGKSINAVEKLPQTEPTIMQEMAKVQNTVEGFEKKLETFTSGKDGKSAYQIAVDNGFEGSETEWLASLKGSDGVIGVNGKSAYQEALDNGFVGSEEEWLESLKGAKGDKGADGKSPKITIEQTDSGRKISIVNADESTNTYDIVDTNVNELKSEVFDVIKGNNLFTGTQTIKVGGAEYLATNYIDVSEYLDGVAIYFYINKKTFYGFSFFDEEKNIVSSGSTANTNLIQITKATGAKYFALRNNASLQTVKFVEWIVFGNKESDYIPDNYIYKSEKIPEIAGEKITDQSVGISKLGDNLVVKYPTNNLFKSDEMLGTYNFRNNGTAVVVSNTSNWIPIVKGNVYCSSLSRTQYYYFDSDKNFVSSATYITNPVVFTAPCDGYVLIAKCKNGTIVVEGSTLENYYDTYYLFNPQFLPDSKNNSKWNGKKWLAIGDSITDASVANKGYPYYVSKELGLQCKNVGANGKTVSYFFDKIDGFADDFDLITVLLGTNNQGYNCSIGAINDDYYQRGDYSNNLSYTAQLQHLIDLLLAKYPTKTIAFFTPIKRSNPSGNQDEDGYVVNALGLTTKPYAETMIKVCDYYGLPCLDLFTNGINPRTEEMRKLYFLKSDGSDGTHPNNAGHARFTAPAIIDFLNKIAPCEE